MWTDLEQPLNFIYEHCGIVQLVHNVILFRFAVIAFVLEQYNQFIAFMGEASLSSACKMALL
jgi:hypothetical protein